MEGEWDLGISLNLCIISVLIIFYVKRDILLLAKNGGIR